MRLLKLDKPRVLGLDILWALAILLVVYGHGALFLPKQWDFYYHLPFPALDGVSIFFVLSGFFIGNILLKIIQESEFKMRDLVNFWIRRWFRTLPNYFFVLLVLIVLSVLLGRGLTGLDWRYFIFLQSFYTPHPAFFPEVWSLCVEEWFYLLFPLGCYLMYRLNKNKTQAVLYTALFFLLAPLLARSCGYLLHLNFTQWDAIYRKMALFRLDSIMYGVVAAYLYQYKNALWIKYKHLCLAAGILLIILTTLHHRFWDSAAFLVVYRYNLEAGATFLLLPFFSAIKTIRFKKIAGVITFISIISYSMYLINFSLVLNIFVPATTALIPIDALAGSFAFIFKYILFWLYTLFFSYLIYHFFERPMTSLRERF